MSWLFASVGQSIGSLASASVLPINIQGWFPPGLTGSISLVFKGLLRVFSGAINSSALSLLHGPALTVIGCPSYFDFSNMEAFAGLDFGVLM